MKITIQDFQSLGWTELEAEGLTVLVGKSNLGKSAAIRAVEGALFNRAGDEFIREGSKVARVALERLPGAAGPLDVVWEKGRNNVNRFTVGTVEYNKVGQAAPAPVEEAGYRDIRIGNETLRPQVAGQFDPLFLLTRPGSFVSDVLTIISRLGVLLAADRACTKDLKTTRGLVGIRGEDLKVSEAKLAVLQPVVGQHARVAALEAEVGTARALAGKLLAAVILSGQRTLLRQALQPLPDSVGVPEDLGVREQAVRQQVLLRQRLAPTVALSLPVPVPESAQQEVERRAGVVASVRPLASVLKPMRWLTTIRLPEVGVLPETIHKIDEWRRRADELEGLMVEQEMAVKAATEAGSAANGMAGEADRLEGALTEMFSTLEVCPLCERPMEKVHVH